MMVEFDHDLFQFILCDRNEISIFRNFWRTTPFMYSLAPLSHQHKDEYRRELAESFGAGTSLAKYKRCCSVREGDKKKSVNY